MHACVCVCMRACVRVCMRACVRVCMHAWVHAGPGAGLWHVLLSRLVCPRAAGLPTTSRVGACLCMQQCFVVATTRPPAHPPCPPVLARSDQKLFGAPQGRAGLAAGVLRALCVAGGCLLAESADHAYTWHWTCLWVPACAMPTARRQPLPGPLTPPPPFPPRPPTHPPRPTCSGKSSTARCAQSCSSCTANLTRACGGAPPAPGRGSSSKSLGRACRGVPDPSPRKGC